MILRTQKQTSLCSNLSSSVIKKQITDIKTSKNRAIEVMIKIENW